MVATLPQEVEPFSAQKPGVAPAITRWTIFSLLSVARSHPLPAALAFAFIFFMRLEYTMVMVKSGFEPWDVGFACTARLHDVLTRHPTWNSAFAAANTAFVMFHVGYVLWTWLVEGRTRPTIAILFLYTCRGILGYATQLPVPQDFLGSGLDFPVGNTSFFLFFSGHVAGSVIVSLDLRRRMRCRLATLVNVLNVLQCLRLLVTRGHYTIDLVVGAGAGWAVDLVAGRYTVEMAEKEKVKGN